MCSFTDVRVYGAKGDGISDDAVAFNAATKNGGNIYIPQGEYRLCSTVLIHSHTHIVASPLAHIFIACGAQKGRYDFLLSTSPDSESTCDVSITGGIWDGNCGENDRGNDMFSQTATTGTMLNFQRISSLTLESLVLKNPLCYYLRFCEANNVKIQNIRYESDVITGNQDGIHLAGFCRDFVICNLYGTSGSPNDDFIALNADDNMQRQENHDMLCGAIENIVVENVKSELCHRFVRLLSVDSPISNVTIRNISGSCVNSAVSIDAARDCRTPLFNDNDKPDGVGRLENILLENFAVSKEKNKSPYIELETNCVSFTVRNFCGLNPECAVARIRRTCTHELYLSQSKMKNALPETVNHESDITIEQSSISYLDFKSKS